MIQQLIRRSRAKFDRVIERLIGKRSSQHPGVLGCFPRNAHASFDEAAFVYRLFGDGAKESVMIDVGAHRGSALGRFLKQGWKVFAFEPDSKNRAELQTRQGAHGGLVIDERAVSDKVGAADFFASTESTGISSLVPFHASHAQTGSVQTTTLANVVDEYDIARIDFLKIDAEGMDLMVLKGHDWKRVAPRVILCEFEDLKTVPLGYTMHDMARFLLGKGYEVYVSEWYPIVRYGISHDWRRLVKYPASLESRQAWGNLLAFAQAPDESKFAACARRSHKIA